MTGYRCSTVVTEEYLVRRGVELVLVLCCHDEDIDVFVYMVVYGSISLPLVMYICGLTNITLEKVKSFKHQQVNKCLANSDNLS